MEKSCGVVAPQPFLRWVGGKTYLLPEIKKRIPPDWDRERDLYVEPFLGAGALFWDLNPPRSYLNDANAELVNTYAELRGYETLEPVLRAIAQAYQSDPEQYYYQMRTWKLRPEECGEAAVRFLFSTKPASMGCIA